MALFVLALAIFGTAQGVQYKQGPGESDSSGKSEKKPKIATSHVYDLDYERPKGLSFAKAVSMGLMVSGGLPSAWETDTVPKVENVEYANPGNLVWSLGARMLLGDGHELSMKREQWEGDESLSAFYIATGPIFNPEVSYNGYFTTLLSEVERPTILVGAGVGGDYGEFQCATTMIPKELELLDVIHDRIKKYGGFVGLRGECAYSLVKKYGYTGFYKLGCPSLFINTHKNLGKKLEVKYNSLVAAVKAKDAQKLRIAVAMPDRYTKKVVPFLTKILVEFPNSILVHQQTNGDSILEHACKQMNITKPSRPSYMFYDALDWRQFSASMDLVISARIHGSMIAIAAETPAMLIPVDMRVLELGEAMHIPHIMPNDLPEDDSNGVIEDLSGAVSALKRQFNGKTFDNQRSAYAATYKELFSKVGLRLNPAIANL